jgi:hypothetical protein
MNEVDTLLDELGISLTLEVKTRLFKEMSRVSSNFL